MRIDQALAKIGVTVVKVDEKESSLTLQLRVQTDSDSKQRWKRTVEAFVPKVVNSKTWSADVSKRYFAQHGGVRFLWRVVLTGNVKQGAKMLTDTVLEVLREGVELDSMPLVGRANYPFDPQRGLMKGFQPLGAGQQAVSMHFQVGGS